MDTLITEPVLSWIIVAIVAIGVSLLLRLRFKATEPPDPDPAGIIAGRQAKMRKEMWKSKRESILVIEAFATLFVMRWLFGFEISALSGIAFITGHIVKLSWYPEAKSL